MDTEIIKLYEDSVEKLEEVNKQLAPLIEKEKDLQEKFAPIRTELKKVCSEISQIKKDTDYVTHLNRVTKFGPKIKRGEI